MSFLDIFNPIAKVIDDFTLSEEEKLKLEIELKKVEVTSENKILEVYGQVSKAEAQIASQSLKLRQAEINSPSWLTRNIRPILWLIFSLPLVVNYVMYPLIFNFSDSLWQSFDQIKLPPEFWDLYKIFSGGYIGSRGLEKIVGGFRK